ncbi:DUF4382 domain-containing protein [Panacibacter ginsenosidivorans]|uniref:DUF4382 domain-containing protein n=1 Tax=Panacibacter ginsenosidivorans TaxID=1813871 RepID=A0A5B8V8T9_9BACT|nr:DUF4382 domain-containing protein [Panacibacter ginsenosidivorans]QEC67824.1 DUF4382 domain-containing protein [Panacibacter ginsenosidivorans]
MKVSIVCFIACLLFASCDKTNSNESKGNASMSIYLTDDPSLYDEVNIDIQGVEVNASDSSESGWIALPMPRRGVFNLLHLRNGLDTLLASGLLPAGKISQIRLILGTSNSVVINGISFPLETPSAQQSGIKLLINAELTPGIDYKVWTDFDAARSVVTTGNGKYLLKPVIRVYTKAVSGSITGIVQPIEADAWIYALSGINDTLASARPDTLTGSFIIQGLDAGSYSLAIDGANSYNDTLINNIPVTSGSVTDAGTIILHK